MGKVYLIGAGPGDVELITVKATKILAKADVVLYDYLSNVELLEYCKADCVKIYAGKKEKQHTFSQEEINEMLVEYGAKHDCVARLKGGDPFVFGRGVEEIETLIARGIAYEVVPGITAGVAVPAYMGIPVTARDISASVTFVTGHLAENGDNDVKFQALAKAVDTLVIYMGVSNLERIVAELQKGGKKADTPIALIRWGTYPQQEMIKGTLATIVSVVKEANFKAPALTIVGEVVNFSEQLQPIVRECRNEI
ncbi:MAG: uroporphyrinogen-III C-methyltransferase [Flavobacteriaceae bacterium]|nr:uroporphyrinogen-III C-methyltransferase [Flavobacteriaceae bacterium]